MKLMFNDKYADRIGTSTFHLMFNRETNSFESFSEIPLSVSAFEDYQSWKNNLQRQHDVIWPAVKQLSVDKHNQSLKHFQSRHGKAEIARREVMPLLAIGFQQSCRLYGSSVCW